MTKKNKRRARRDLSKYLADTGAYVFRHGAGFVEVRYFTHVLNPGICDYAGPRDARVRSRQHWQLDVPCLRVYGDVSCVPAVDAYLTDSDTIDRQRGRWWRRLERYVRELPVYLGDFRTVMLRSASMLPCTTLTDKAAAVALAKAVEAAGGEVEGPWTRLHSGEAVPWRHR